MKIGEIGSNLVKALIVGGAIYGVVNWQANKPQGDEFTDFAERACTDEINSRYDVSTVRVYSIKNTNNGFVVRATVTLARGATAKVYCLTNSHGGVKEVTIEER
jgi:hypothetical protein